MSGSRELPALVVGIARLGYRGPIRERALSSLVAWASACGVAEVLSWVREDSGLLVVPSWQFPMGWQIGKEDRVLHAKRRWCVAPVESAEVLAAKLTEQTWMLCTAFQHGSYLFLNDSTSEDGAQEYAVGTWLPSNRKTPGIGEVPGTWLSTRGRISARMYCMGSHSFLDTSIGGWGGRGATHVCR